MRHGLFLLGLLFLSACQNTAPLTPVAIHGPLHTEGARLLDACNRPVQLTGMSFFWNRWAGKEYWNSEVVRHLRDDWRVEIVRASMGVREPGRGRDYYAEPEASLAQVHTVVDAAIEHGVYVIIDFHAHPNFQTTAVEFFGDMARRYTGAPNVIYEIWNEPIGEEAEGVAKWAEIKTYARAVIAAIRAHDADNIIVVGTPFYSQLVNVAADDPLRVDAVGNPVHNIAYTLHFYAGQHGQALRDKGEYAIQRGLPLFVTECGRVGVDYGPENNLDEAEWARWVSWMDRHQISYCKWSLSTKHERSSSLLPGAPIDGYWDPETHLTEEGRWNRAHFRAANATSPTACEAR